MRQVSQMTKVMVTQAESSIEMQLNPANLGKVYLQVVSREGVITAQLAAQNEAVKEALENQVAILKENMNQQGIKVEAEPAQPGRGAAGSGGPEIFQEEY